MVFRNFLLLFLLLSSLSLLNAQAVKISRDQYFSNLEKASDLSDSIFPRRSSRVQEEFKDGRSAQKITSIYEYAAADKTRRVVETTEGERSEYIQIGRSYFCKHGKSTWTKSKTPCEPVNMTMSLDPDSEEFTVEKVGGTEGENKVFHWYKTWVFPKTVGIEYFNEQIFTVRPDGVLVRIDIRHGKTRNKQFDGIQTEVYEYKMSDIKIEPPIK